jgi:hypothetical protein
VAISFVASAFYILTAAGALSGFYLLKKSAGKCNAVVWLPVTAVTFLCWNALCAGVINLIRIPVNLYSMGALNLLAAVFLWFWIVRSKEHQAYEVHAVDVVALAAVAALAVVVGVMQFGPNLQIHYETSDPAVHMKSAMDVINNQSVRTNYYAQLNNALFISVFAPLVSLAKYYKLFILADILMFALSGAMFYAVIRRFSHSGFVKVCSVVVTCVYMLGYPWNNMVFGFVYLGMGVTLIAFLVFLCDCFLHETLCQRMNVFLLMIGCLSLFLCYSLFVPMTYLGVFFTIAVYFYRKGRLWRWRTAFTELAVFLIPVVLGLLYAFIDFFGETNSPGNQIAQEGYIYRNLYSSFLVFLPFALYGLFSSFSKRDWGVGEILLLIFGVFTVGFLFMGMYGKVSSYYYYKMYYPLWFLVFYLFQSGLSKLAAHSKAAVVSYALPWLFVATMAVTGVDRKINERNANFNPEVCSWSFFDVFNFNRTRAFDGKVYSPDRLQAAYYVLDHCNPESVPVPAVDEREITYWYEAITNQRLKNYYLWGDDTDFTEYLETVKARGCRYLLVVKEDPFAVAHRDYFDTLERIFENDTCYVAKFEPIS